MRHQYTTVAIRGWNDDGEATEYSVQFIPIRPAPPYQYKHTVIVFADGQKIGAANTRRIASKKEAMRQIKMFTKGL
jgi:hypothetical protein